MKHKTAIRGCLCAMLSGVCWGFSGTCGQYLYANFEVSSIELTCARLLGAGVIMMLFSLIHHRSTLVNVWKSPKDAFLLVCFGLFGMISARPVAELLVVPLSAGIYFQALKKVTQEQQAASR